MGQADHYCVNLRVPQSATVMMVGCPMPAPPLAGNLSPQPAQQCSANSCAILLDNPRRSLNAAWRDMLLLELILGTLGV